MMHYHGTPITPTATLEGELAGRCFCVSFSQPQQIKHVHRIGQSVMLDNGAFSVWKRGLDINWDTWRAWAEEWLDYPTTWAVLPDSIEGDEDDNDRLLTAYRGVRDGVPVWHLHESLERLSRLANDYGKVCFGSSGAYAVVGTDGWHRRVSKAFDALADDLGRVPWVHMLRGMQLSGTHYPFASVDSTDIARNHSRPHNNARVMADRWDVVQNPARWVNHRQEELC